MTRVYLVLVILIGGIGVGAGCKAFENAVDYENMTGSIPNDSFLSGLGSGKNR